MPEQVKLTDAQRLALQEIANGRIGWSQYARFYPVARFDVLQRLRDKGLIRFTYGAPIYLTAAGREALRGEEGDGSTAS